MSRSIYPYKSSRSLIHREPVCSGFGGEDLFFVDDGVVPGGVVSIRDMVVA